MHIGARVRALLRTGLYSLQLTTTHHNSLVLWQDTIAVCNGKPAALVPTRAACFAKPLTSDAPLLAQMRSFSSYLPCHEEPQQLHITRNAHADIVFAMPCLFGIPSQCCDAPASPLSQSPHLAAAWRSLAALDPVSFEHSVLAVAVRGTPAMGPDSGLGRAVKRVKMILEEGERGGKPLEN